MTKEAENAGHRSRLRARFMSGGMAALAEYEIVELLLTCAIARRDVKPVAKSLMAKYGSVKAILNADPAELSAVEGMGEASACMVKFVRDLIPLYHLQTLERSSIELDSVDKLIEFFRARMEHEKKEVLEMACFDPSLRLLPGGAVRLFEGSASSANVDIRQIVEKAIKLGASSIVIAHNHPNGDARPSRDDIAFTRRLSLACRPIRLDFIEHLIVASGATFSFRRDGRFDDLCDSTVPCGDDYGGGESDVASPRKRLKTQ